MTTAIQHEKPEKISMWLSKVEVRDRIAKAIGKAYDADFFLEQILIALNHPSLIGCTEQSKFKAAHTCAALGMLPSMQHVALIPRKNKGVEEVTVMPQWQGLQALMLRHPDVEFISHSLVHPTDEFVFDGTTQSVVRHDYDPFADDRQFKKMEDIRGGYLKVNFRNKRPPVFHMVKASTIEKARKCAQADNIWSNWFEEQCIKTLYRNGFARRVVPIDPMLNQMQLQAAIQQEDAVLENDPSRVDSSPKVEHAKPKSRTEAVVQRIGVETLQPDPIERGKDKLASPFDGYAARIASANSLEQLEAVNVEIQQDGDLNDVEAMDLSQQMDERAKGLK